MCRKTWLCCFFLIFPGAVLGADRATASGGAVRGTSTNLSIPQVGGRLESREPLLDLTEKNHQVEPGVARLEIEAAEKERLARDLDCPAANFPDRELGTQDSLTHLRTSLGETHQRTSPCW